ncbi:hypothetical protein ACFSUD_02540 [Sulfitobacter aestuarii]|uniref:Transmembrane protein (PGPGW) n=1 Tax=Sulfitobacter aestuarii TaxID=2161676 RepID=A0ABW5TXS4_9RHOB
MRDNRPTLKQRLNRFLAYVRLKVPAQWRLPLGVLLICLGMLGFLPILGFWMVPLGVAIAALGLRPLRARWRRRRKHD